MRRFSTMYSSANSKFQSTHRVSDATDNRWLYWKRCLISIHAPRERCDNTASESSLITDISIHAPRERCDLLFIPYFINHHYFNPRTAWAMRRLSPALFQQVQGFQSTHRVSDATVKKLVCQKNISISIHAPRERCDSYVLAHIDDQTISIHAPRERCDDNYILPKKGGQWFQSTHRVSDATANKKLKEI